MKSYLFNPETGVYLGDYFVDEVPVTCGPFTVPPKATTIAPPEGGLGHKLLFDVVAQCWEVHTHWEQGNPLPIGIVESPRKEFHHNREQEYPQPTNVAKPPQKGTHHYTGSLLIFIGFLLWIAALCDNINNINIMCGLSLILGTAAFLSLEERMRNPDCNIRLLKYLEWSSITFIAICYSYELCTHKINSNILLNSVTPIASVSLYFYYLMSCLKRDQTNQFFAKYLKHPFLKLSSSVDISLMLFALILTPILFRKI